MKVKGNVQKLSQITNGIRDYICRFDILECEISFQKETKRRRKSPFADFIVFRIKPKDGWNDLTWLSPRIDMRERHSVSDSEVHDIVDEAVFRIQCSFSLRGLVMFEKEDTV